MIKSEIPAHELPGRCMSLDWKDFQGVNAAAVEELYDRYRADPQSVDAETRNLFSRWTPPADTAGAPAPAAEPARQAPSSVDLQVAVGARDLAQAIRRYGHLAAQIDPLGSRPLGDPALDLATHGVTEADLRALPASLIKGPVAEGASSMWEVVTRLRAIYCSTTGYDFAHIFVPDERHWLREAIETGRYRAPEDPIDPMSLLEQ